MSKFRQLIYRLRFITRYATFERVRDEDVAQHSFCVAAIVIGLSEEYKFDVGKATVMAVAHDIPEAYTGDILHTVKMSNPKFYTELNRVERRVCSDLPEVIQDCLEEFRHSDGVEVDIVKLADALQVLQYVESEARLGNTSLDSIHCECSDRINRLREGLQHAKHH